MTDSGLDKPSTLVLKVWQARDPRDPSAVGLRHSTRNGDPGVESPDRPSRPRSQVDLCPARGRPDDPGPARFRQRFPPSKLARVPGPPDPGRAGRPDRANQVHRRVSQVHAQRPGAEAQPARPRPARLVDGRAGRRSRRCEFRRSAPEAARQSQGRLAGGREGRGPPAVRPEDAYPDLDLVEASPVLDAPDRPRRQTRAPARSPSRATACSSGPQSPVEATSAMPSSPIVP